MQVIRWNPAPEDHDYPAARDYPPPLAAPAEVDTLWLAAPDGRASAASVGPE